MIKCKKGIGNCILEIKYLENGDVLEYCTVCDFSYLHKFDMIQNNNLSPHKKDN